MEPIPIPPPQLGTRPDMDAEHINPLGLVRAENVISRDGSFRVRAGLTVLGDDIDERPMGYISVVHEDGTIRFVQGTTLGWHKMTGTAWTDITGAALTGTASDPVIFRTFSKAGATWILGTNGANTMKKWDGDTATYADVSGTPPRARTMMVLFDRVILGNLLTGGTVSPVAIDVSANKDFDSGWGSQLVALLADTEGPIMCMQEMGTLQGGIIKSDALYLLIAQGGIVPFRIEWITRLPLNGPPSPAASSVLSGGLPIWLGKDGSINIFDGAGVTQLPYAVQRQIVTTWNEGKSARAWIDFDSSRRELWVVYPLQGNDDPNGGIIVNMDNREVYPIRFESLKMSAGGRRNAITATGITIGELNVPIGSLTQTIGDFGENVNSRMVLGDIGGQTYQDIGTTDGGATIPFHWEMPVKGAAERYTTVGRIRHRFKPTTMAQQVSVKLGTRNEGGDIEFDAAQNINISSPARKATGHRTSAEYFSLRFEGNASDEVVYRGSTAYVAPRGRR